MSADYVPAMLHKTFGLLQLRPSLIAQLVKNPPAMQETQVRFLGREDPLEKGTTPGVEKDPTPIFFGFPCGSADKESACNVEDLG